MPVSYYLNSSPSAPAITINQTIINLDGEALIPIVDRFTIAAGTIVDNGTGSIRYMVLSQVPIRSDSVLLFKNALVQRPNVDYSILGEEITLNEAATASDEFQAKYESVASSLVLSSASPGMIVDFDYSNLAQIPAGWLAMNGATVVSYALYPALHDYLALHLTLTVEAASQGTGPYTLMNFQNSIYQPATGTIVVIKQIIKT